MTDRERLIDLIKKAEKQELLDFFTADLDEAIDMSGGTQFNGSVEYLANYLIEHGIIVLPCKFGSGCYVIPTIHNKLPDITGMKCIGYALSYDAYNINLITEKNKLYQPCFGEFGKTVFLTREEAEKALKEQKNEGM